VGHLDADALVVWSAVIERIGQLGHDGLPDLCRTGKAIGLLGTLSHQPGVFFAGVVASDVPGTRCNAGRLRRGQGGDMPGHQQYRQNRQRQQAGGKQVAQLVA
jgi:hypothetical protein